MREPRRHELHPHPRRDAVVRGEPDAAALPDTEHRLSAARDTAAPALLHAQPSRFMRLLKPAEVAEELGVSRSWVYAAAEDGRLPSVRLGGPEGPLRFVPEDLHRWLQDARANWRPGRQRQRAR